MGFDPGERERAGRETSDALWREFYRCDPVDTRLDHCCSIFLEVPYIEIEVKVGGLMKVEIFPVDRCPQCGRLLKDLRKLKRL